MTVLVPMDDATYPCFLETSVRGYAEKNVTARRWPAAGAVERARIEFERLLPLGLATPDQHLYDIRDLDGETTVGHLWIALQRHPGGASAYVYDVAIVPAHRRRGHARRAFVALESVAAALGADSIGLHVHAHNEGARALYDALGFGVTGLNMVKRLGAA